MTIESTIGSFEGTRARNWKGAQLYRLVVSDQRIAIVHIGGALAASGGRNLWVHFGLLGALIGYFVEKRAAKKRAAEAPQLEATSLDDLLARDAKNNFELRLENIERAELQKPGFLQGALAAKLQLSAGGEQHLFALADKAQALKCRELLEAKLSGRLVVDPKLKWLTPNAPIA